MIQNKRIRILLLIFMVANITYAQKERTEGIVKSAMKGFEYKIKGGFSMGGTSPLPLPAEIREINTYTPMIGLALEADVSKYFKEKWGIQIGIRVEGKGMKTDARVKNYHMKMIAEDGGEMEGAWTGNVKTKVWSSYVTIPVLALYKISPRWQLNAGPYISYVLDRQFSGSAYDGYLRDMNPTGEKVSVDNATYDFSGDLRRFQWGAQLGAEWRAFSHLNVYADLTWGLNSIFKKDFKSVTFDMYPIYANLGFAYAF